MPGAPAAIVLSARAGVQCELSCTSTSAPARPPPQSVATTSGTPAVQAAGTCSGVSVAAPNEVRSAGTAPGPSRPSVTPTKRPTLVAATVIASGAEPGEEIEPPPR